MYLSELITFKRRLNGGRLYRILLLFVFAGEVVLKMHLNGFFMVYGFIYAHTSKVRFLVCT